jgi:hypothetical protein
MYRSRLLWGSDVFGSPTSTKQPNSLYLDFEKINRLRRPSASRKGVLVVGFEEEAVAPDLEQDLQEVETIVGINIPPWKRWKGGWNSTNRAGEVTRAVMWTREIEEGELGSDTDR